MAKIIYHHADAKYCKSYATYERAVKEAEAVVEKFGLTNAVVFILPCGDKHDRFTPLFQLGATDAWQLGGLAHAGFNVTI